MTNKKRVLLTGGHGFVGQNLWRELRARPDIIDVIGRFRSKDFNLLRSEDSDKIVESWKPDVVVHLAAACGGIGANMMNPATFWYQNTLMCANIAESCAKFGVKHLITLGTVCSYGQNAKTPFTEDMLFTEWPEITNRPYGVSKLNMMEGLRAYREQYGLIGSYLIPTNLYGPWDNFDLNSSHVIPAMLRKMLEAKRQKKDFVDLWGDGTPTRDFLYVSDLCKAIVQVIEKPIEGNYNLGSGKEISMAGLAEAIAVTVGFQGDLVWNIGMPNGQMRRLVDFTKIKELKRTYRWYVRKELLTAAQDAAGTT
jgi:GDP-L-fucose synthase